MAPRTRPLLHDESDRLISDETHGVGRLIELMRRLREPEHGCPWDLEQTFRSIAPYTIEEAHEVADAIERGALDELADELGDLLLQVVYHSQIAAEDGAFGFDDVVEAITAKMLRRHPHVFGDKPRDDFGPDVRERAWEALKAEERAAKGETRASALDGVPAGLPGLTRAMKLQVRAARVGFDWPDTSGVMEKIVEEAGELVEAQAGGDQDRIEEEYADLLFVMTNLGRHLKVDPEAALRRANAKFEGRFRAVEATLAASGRRVEGVNLAEMDTLWDEAKARERAALIKPE